MSAFTLSIDGEQLEASRRFPVINPATEETWAEAPVCSEAELERAVRAAARAFAAWRTDEAKRRAALSAAAGHLQTALVEIAQTLTREQGKPLSMATAEVAAAVAQLRSVAEQPLPRDVTDNAKGRLEIQHRPYGVVAGITPWNFPVLIAMSKIAPALLAGNTMVLKPSPFTPLSTLRLGAELNRALPPGVLNVVSGGDALGAQLVTHPLVRKISFTGSVATGKRVARVAAEDLKRVTLELGGNDPAIVLEDAEPSRFGLSVFWSAFANTGQVCLAIKRLYVPESRKAEWVEALSNEAKKVRVGDGMEPETQLGPINNPMQLDRVVRLVDDARARGASVHTGGERLGRKGYFYAPTIVSDVADSVALVAEEQFGPVLPVLTYRDVSEAVARANDTDYGLGASVWSADVERATEIAGRIDAGTIWVNRHMVLSPKAPFGGAKCSGLGYVSGKWALEAYTQKHVINVRR